MKFPLPAAVVVLSVFVAGCNSLENPLGSFFRTGNDARVFNAQTGEYEWPQDSQKRRRNPGTAPAVAPAPAQERQGDGRYFDTQKGQWVEAPPEKSSSKAKAKPATPSPLVTTAPPLVDAAPPVRPSRASGVYNPSTGQIEWRSYDPAPAPTPEPRKKSWYWPF